MDFVYHVWGLRPPSRAVSLTQFALLPAVIFSMSYVQGETSNNKIPVALGVKGKNLYLSCVLKGDTPTLQLEVSEAREAIPPCSPKTFCQPVLPRHPPAPPSRKRRRSSQQVT